MKKLRSFLVDVKKELKKVRWANKKEMTSYSFATISFIVFFALFFTMSDMLLAGLKVLMGN